MATERAFVAKCTWVVDSVGTKQTFLLGTRGFATGPADDPPNTVVRELLVDPGSYQNELFSGARVTGVVRPSFGGMVFANEDGVLDDWASYGISGGPVELYDGVIGTPFPSAWDLVFKAYGNGLSATVPNERTGVGAAIDFDRITVSLQSREALLDTPVATDVYTPGDTYVASTLTKKKPFVLGNPGWIPLVLLDPVLLIYQVQLTAADSRFLFGTGAPLYQPHDGALPLTFEGYYATALDGIDPAQSPSPGYYKVWAPNGTAAPTGFYGNSTGPCFLRLGSKPVEDLRIKTLGLYLASQAEGVRPWTFIDLCQRAGLADVTPTSMAPGSYVKQAGNRYIAGDETYLEVMNDAANVTFTAFGFDRLDRFFCFDLQDPDANPSEPIAYVFTEHNSRNFRRIPVPGQERPVWQLNGSAGQTWPGTVNGAADPAVQEEFTREPWQDRWTVSSAAVRAANPGAISVDVKFDGNEFTGGDPAKLAHGKRYIELFGGRREIFTLECTEFEAATFGLEIGARVQVRRNRFGCDTGRQFRVVTRRINGLARTITFGLWGGAAGPGDAVLGSGEQSRPVDDAADYFIDRQPAPYTWAAIVVPNKVLAGLQYMPAPYTYCVIEGSSPIGGPSVNASLALLFEGPDGSTSIIDSSTYGHPVVQAGLNDVEISATAPAVGVGAGFWDSNRVLSVAHDASLDLTSGDFAITARVRATSLASQIIVAKAPSTDLYPWQLAIIFDGVSAKFAFRGFNSGGSLLYDLRSTTILNSFLTSPGTWFKVTGTRSGTTFALLVNDVTEASVTGSGSLWANTAAVAVGGYLNTGSARMSGRLDDVIIVKGSSALPADPLLPLNTLLDLRFDGTDGATTTTDSSVYAWPVALTGGAELDTAQQQSGTASLLCNGTGGRAVVTGATGLVPLYPGGDLVLYIRPLTVADCVLATLGDAAGYSWRLSVVGGKVQLVDNALPFYPAVTITASAAPSLTVGTWTKVTVRRGSPPNATINLLIDDVFAGWAPWTWQSYGLSPAALTIGADYDGTSAFHGHIDSVSVALL